MPSIYLISIFFSYQIYRRHAEEEDINAPPPQIQAAIKNNDIGNLLDLDWDEPSAEAASSHILQQGNSFNDLLSIGNSEAQTNNQAPTQATTTSNNIDDIMNLFNSPSTPQQSQQPQQQQQQPQVMNDFTNDLFGSSASPPVPQQQPPSSSTTNDPFADLF